MVVDQLKAGGTFRGGIISSPGEFIPRAAYMALDAQVFGYSMTPIEVTSLRNLKSNLIFL